MIDKRNAPYQPILEMQKQIESLSDGNRKLRNENVVLRKANADFRKEIKGLLACCSFEKKVDYMLKEWIDKPFQGSEELDRQAFALKLAEFARKELQ